MVYGGCPALRAGRVWIKRMRFQLKQWRNRVNTPLTIDQLNVLDCDAFVVALGGIVENSPWVAEAACNARPFADRAALHRAMLDALRSAPEDVRLAVIRAHPDLAGRAALAGELTRELTREQASAGLDQLTPDEYAEFMRLNHDYVQRFGFPFVICVREHDKAGILRAFRERLHNRPADELSTAVSEVGKIAALRLDDAVA